jgi:hypothetical protein
MWLSDICKNKHTNAKVLSSRFLMTISPFTDCVIYQDLPIVLFTAVIQLIGGRYCEILITNPIDGVATDNNQNVD